VNGDVVEAKKVFINVGARAAIPTIPGLEGVPYLTNSNMMAVDYLPAHLVVIGGSYVGLEFAQMYRRFGSDVTVITDGPRLIPRDDQDVALALKSILEKEGIAIRTNTNVERISNRGDEIELRLIESGRKATVRGTHLLIATGRRPNTDDLGLDRAGIKMDS